MPTLAPARGGTSPCAVHWLGVDISLVKKSFGYAISKANAVGIARNKSRRLNFDLSWLPRGDREVVQISGYCTA